MLGAGCAKRSPRYDILSPQSTLMKTAFTARRLYTPTEQIEDPLLVVEDGRITEVAPRAGKAVADHTTIVDFGDATISPGYLRHTYPRRGGDRCDARRPSELPRLGKFLATHGVTGYFPTTVAAPLDATCAALERLADVIEAAPKCRQCDSVEARPLGIHLEGPFLSHKRRGVHPPENLVAPTIEIFDRLWQAARGHVRMMTIAPEIPGAMEVIAEAARRGVCVSIGHSDAEMPIAQGCGGSRSAARHTHFQRDAPARPSRARNHSAKCSAMTASPPT